MDDVAAGTLPADVLSAARRAIETDGYTVIGGLVSAESRALLTPSVLEDAALVRSDGELTPHEQRTAIGHLQLGLRRYAPYVRADLVANPLVESLVAAVLGRGAWLGFYNGNVNCPGSGCQPLHFDRPYSWKTRSEAAADGKPWPPPATTLSCSVALSKITVETGATEIYPGSHRETAVADWTTNRLAGHPELVAGWGPPSAMEIPAGGVCFRDPRMWHRGVPNLSTTARPMLALTYHSGLARHWRGRLVRDMDPADVDRCRADETLKLMDDGTLGDGRLVFHASARSAFEQPSSHGVCRNVRFVDDPLHVNHFVDAHLVGGARVTTEPVTAPPVR